MPDRACSAWFRSAASLIDTSRPLGAQFSAAMTKPRIERAHADGWRIDVEPREAKAAAAEPPAAAGRQSAAAPLEPAGHRRRACVGVATLLPAAGNALRPL